MTINIGNTKIYTKNIFMRQYFLTFLVFLTTYTAFGQDVHPLITTHWDQGSPYNSLFLAQDNGKKPLTGCVPIAMAQLIHYFDGSKDSLHLILECANNVPTSYFDTYTSSRGGTVLPVLKWHFNFSKYMNCAFQNDYYGEKGRKAWRDLIFSEIRQGRPVMVKGEHASSSGKHIFIIDGIRDTLVHINFGWGGKGNGYYPLDDLRGYSHNLIAYVDAGKEDYVPHIDTLRVSKPGMLGSMLRDKWTLRHIRIEGDINADDIRSLRSFARYDPTTMKNQPLRSIDLSSTHIGFLPDSAFADCSGLTMVSLPEGITTTGRYAFGNCANLDSIHLPSTLRIIAVGAFSRCNSLHDIVIPNDVTNIQNMAFYGCVSLREVRLPQVLQTIGMRAFKHCTQLQKLRLPASLSVLGKEATDDCPNVKVSVDPANPYLTVENNVVSRKALLIY